MDFVMLIAAGLATYFLRTRILDVFRPVLFEFNLPLIAYIPLVIGVSVLFVGIYAVSGLYSMRVRSTLTGEFLKIAVATSAGIMIIIMYIFLRQELFNSRFLVMGGWFFSVVFVFAGRIMIRQAQRYVVSTYGFGVHRLMVIGDDEASREVVRGIQLDPFSGYRIVKQLTNPELSEVISAVGNPGVDEIILANPNYPAEKVTQLVDFAHENHIIFKFIPNIYQTLTTNFDIDVIKNMPVIELKRTPLDGWGKVLKRIFDISAALLGLLIFSPVMAMIAFAIKWETEGPVFARLKRVSKNKEFTLYKFRGMVNNAEELLPYLTEYNERKDSPLFKMKNDPRITNVGRFIRKLRIDELPQFLNIVRGDMSLVGPRPHQPDEIARYQKHHKKVLAIKAGATGLAQVSGSSDLPFEDEVALDGFYIENWSLLLDIKIILRTIFRVFTSDASAV